MKRTNKATTTTMVRRVSAALLAVCITTLYLALPVKAATAFTTQYASGYYPGPNTANPDHYYYCALSGTTQSFNAHMDYAYEGQKIRIGRSAVIILHNVTGITELTYRETSSMTGNLDCAHSVSENTSYPDAYYMEINTKYKIGFANPVQVAGLYYSMPN